MEIFIRVYTVLKLIVMCFLFLTLIYYIYFTFTHPQQVGYKIYLFSQGLEGKNGN